MKRETRQKKPMNFKQSDTTFATAFREHYNGKIKDLPNLNWDGDTLTIGDYVMNNPEEWAYLPADEINPLHEAHRVMFDVYDTWLSGVPEITIEKSGVEETDADFFCDITVTIAEANANRQYDIGRLLADAVNERQTR